MIITRESLSVDVVVLAAVYGSGRAVAENLVGGSEIYSRHDDDVKALFFSNGACDGRCIR